MIQRSVYPVLYATVVVVVVLAASFSARARILGECSTILSPSALFLLLFKVEINSHTLILLCRQGSVHSGSAS